MRTVLLRTIVYLAVCALPAVAQPTLMSREMPRVEVSAGASAIYAGPGVDLEQRMLQLGLQSRFAGFSYPNTSPPAPVPGLFAQICVGVAQHAMLGLFLGDDETTTAGRFPSGGSEDVRANIRTRALVASFRPTPWLKFEAGPALIHRLLDFESGGPKFGGTVVGWLAGGDVKFVRRPMTPEHPPFFGYLTAQYRNGPGVYVPAMALPVYGAPRQLLTWPAQQVRMSHWMAGIGFGFAI